MRSRKLKLKNWKSKKKNMKGGHWYPFSTITHKYNIYRDNGQFLKPILWIVYPTFRQRFMLNGQAPTFFLTNGVYTMTYVQSFSDFICYVIFNAFLSFWSFFFEDDNFFCRNKLIQKMFTILSSNVQDGHTFSIIIF